MTARTLLVGVDVGGTNTDVAIAAPDVGRVAIATVPTAAAGEDAVGGSTIKAIDLVLDRAGSSADAVAAIGVGVPGEVAPDKGTVRMAMNLGIHAAPYPIGSAVAERYGVPVLVENDVRVAALGLYDLSPPGPPHILTYLSVGTGISSGTVIDGKLLRGTNGIAGEIGQVVVASEGPVTPGGLPGSLEALASGPAFESGLSADDAADRLAVGIHLIFMAYDPTVVYVGGGVASAPGFVDRLRAAVQRLRTRSALAREFIDTTRISTIPVGSHPGTDGAVYLAQQAMKESGRQRPADQEETA